MEIAEIRDLDGPNLFLLEPAIKLEVDLGGDRPEVAEDRTVAIAIGDQEPAPELTHVNQERAATLLLEAVNALHQLTGQPHPRSTVRWMEDPDHVAIAFAWTHRRYARRLARSAFAIVAGESIDLADTVRELQDLRSSGGQGDDIPEMMTDRERRVPVIGVTGTNGKTTTTRLIASILMHAGKRVGWTSSSGVLIQGESVLDGDYTGPAGAARVFEETDLDVAVLETARGGILLRGLGYESNDVSVVTNISPDHLGLHGVHTVDELARVKRTVAAVTKPEGFAVLNVDDARVLAMRDGLAARPFLVSRTADHPAVAEQRGDGGWCLWVDDGQVHFAHDHVETVLTYVNAIPVTLGGRAAHMLENALCAAAAVLALGLDIDRVRAGLEAFRNKSDQNRGRLNVFEVDGTTVIVDFAHNPAGLDHLLRIGRSLVKDNGKLIAVIGSAGDRPDDSLTELGRLAGEAADVVIAKDTIKYLRGRQSGDMLRLLVEGVPAGSAAEVVTKPSEYDGFEEALQRAEAGDTVAIDAHRGHRQDPRSPRIDRDVRLLKRPP